MTEYLRAPFPYFGGKSRIASTIWERFGQVNNYVEPFFGSGAVMLANPHPSVTETVCDKDHFVANFWRSVRANPSEVGRHADRPVSEVELHHVHYWLVTEGADRLRQIETSRYFYDAEVAGLWAWGACLWIGTGWCSGRGGWSLEDEGRWLKRDNQGINRQLPHLGGRGRGINRQLSALTRQEFIERWMSALSERMRDVRVTCGDWSRVTGPSVTHRMGVTAVFLDPPYSIKANRDMGIYRQDDGDVAHAAARWAVEQGDNPLMRIALAGYQGEHDFPPSWYAHPWKAPGGYGSQGKGRGRKNSEREIVWFSPHCQKISTRTVFGVTVPA